MRRRLSLLAVLGVVVFGGWAKPAFSQVGASAAQLNGAVRDESGGSVAKASITARETGTNRTYTAVSNDNGLYVLANLPPGRYELTVEATGFAKSAQTGIVLSVGQSATIDVVVKVAASAEKVIVTTETPPVEPTRTEISAVISTSQIESLPISGRLFTDFVLLTPGVTTGRTSLQSTFTESEVTRISFGGMRDFSNLVTVDGADTINSATGSQRATPSQEAVSEFRVVNNGFGAEQGRALGGIVNIITKSGTNDMHGSLYDYIENSAMNAHNLLQQGILPDSGGPVPDTLRQNQFGGTLGGPIKKDKTFFFMNYEGQRRLEAAVQSPTLLQNFDLINKAKALLGLAPELSVTPKTQDTDKGFFKLDHQINKNNRLSVRYNIEDGRNLNVLVGDTLDGGGQAASSSGHNNFFRDQSLVGSVSSQLKPSLVNTVLVQYARRHSNFPGVTGQPNLDLPNAVMMGHNFGIFDATYESRGQFADSLYWVKGSHLAKFGVDYNHVNNHIIWPGFSPMRIVLPGVNCLVDFANYMNFVKEGPSSAFLAPNFKAGPCPMAIPGFSTHGDPFLNWAVSSGGPGPGNCPTPSVFACLPSGLPGPGINFADVANGTPVVFWPAALGPGDNSQVDNKPPLGLPLSTTWQTAYPASVTPNYFSDINHGYLGFFAQDQWRVTSKLTLNYGLRWDYETGLSGTVNNYYKAFQPRVGLAYSPDKHTVIRAGFGIFSDRYNIGFFFVTHPQRPTTFVCVVTTPNCPGGGNFPLPGIRDGAFNATYALNQLPFIPGFNPFGPQPADAAANLLQFGSYQNVAMVTNLATGEFSPVGDGTVERASKMPYAEQGSLEIDREVGHGLVINIGYLFVSSHHQVRAENLNVCPPTDGTAAGAVSTGLYKCGDPLPGPPNITGRFNNYTTPPTTADGYPAGKSFFQSVLIPVGLLYYTDNSGNSIYHGANISVTERAGQYFRFNANYTFSKTLDDGTFTTFVSTPQDLYHRSLERANSNQDVRHRFIANFTATGPQKTFLRNTVLSSIITLQGARPFTQFVGFDANNDTNPVTDRVGLAARNTYWGDKLKTVDLRLSQAFKFREKQRIDVAVDAFNAFNRPNVDEVDSVYGTYNFCGGVVPLRYKDAATLATQQGTAGACPAAGPPVPNGDFGAPRKVFNARQFQISLKYSF
jgi:outer membrane receptor protein involved in Fe transport